MLSARLRDHKYLFHRSMHSDSCFDSIASLNFLPWSWVPSGLTLLINFLSENQTLVDCQWPTLGCRAIILDSFESRYEGMWLKRETQ